MALLLKASDLRPLFETPSSMDALLEGITAVMVTHDESLTQYASRVIRLDSGRVVSDESVSQ